MSESTAVQPAVMTEREKFEASDQERFSLDPALYEHKEWGYVDHPIRCRWETWQAAIASRQGERELMERDAALRQAVRQMTEALQNREWADLLSTDTDVTELEGEICKLLGRAK